MTEGKEGEREGGKAITHQPLSWYKRVFVPQPFFPFGRLSRRRGEKMSAMIASYDWKTFCFPITTTSSAFQFASKEKEALLLPPPLPLLERRRRRRRGSKIEAPTLSHLCSLTLTLGGSHGSFSRESGDRGGGEERVVSCTKAFLPPPLPPPSPQETPRGCFPEMEKFLTCKMPPPPFPLPPPPFACQSDAIKGVTSFKTPPRPFLLFLLFLGRSTQKGNSVFD